MTLFRVKLVKQIGQFGISAEFGLPGNGILALFGPSGAGKTSVVNMVAGLVRPDRGLVEAGGVALFDSEKGIDLKPARRRVGYIFQEGRLFPHLTVTGNLNYGRRLLSPRERYLEPEDVIRVLGIENLLKRRPGHLSGGEKQRVAIGRALLACPRLLLMDEPVSSVDESRKKEILELVAAIPGLYGIPILYVSHSIEELKILGAQIVTIESGRTDGT